MQDVDHLWDVDHQLGQVGHLRVAFGGHEGTAVDPEFSKGLLEALVAHAAAGDALLYRLAGTRGRIQGVRNALELFQLSLGRTVDLDLSRLEFRSPIARTGLEIFSRVDTAEGTLAAGKCSLCHSQAGANIDSEFFTRIIGAGLSKADLGYEAMTAAVDEIGTQEATMIHQKIGWLSLIGNLAPLIGLFGTVTGMIGAFNVIATNPNPKPSEMAGGISMALVTTCLGLVVAIPTVTLYTWLRNRVVKVIMEGGTITTELLDRFRPEE